MINILFYHLKPTGCGWYRQLLPYSMLKTLNAIEVKYIEFEAKNGPDGNIDIVGSSQITPDIMEKLDWCDILVFGREWLPQGLALIEIAKHKGKKIVYDLDDNLLIVPDWNPAGRVYNQQQVKDLIVKFLRNVDYITLTHDDLATYFKQFKPTHIMKNFLYEPFLQTSEVYVQKDAGAITIGWAGSSTHHRDLMEIHDVVRDLLAKYHHIVFAFVGYCPPEIVKLDPNRIKVLRGNASTLDYYKIVNGIKLDIAIAPLCGNEFNKYKSNIKLLEYAACGYPVIASKLFEYKKYVNHKKDALLANKYIEWFNGLKSLIESPDLRRDLVKNSQTKMREYCDVIKNCQRWVDVYYDILKRPRETIKSELFDDTFKQRLLSNIYEAAWFGPSAEANNRKRFIQSVIKSKDLSAVRNSFNKNGINFSLQ